MNRLTVTLPRPRDGKVRGAAIPESVVAARAAAAHVTKKRTGGMTDSEGDSDDEGEESYGADDGMGAPSITGTGPGGRVLLKDVEREKGARMIRACFCC